MATTSVVPTAPETSELLCQVFVEFFSMHSRAPKQLVPTVPEEARSCVEALPDRFPRCMGRAFANNLARGERLLRTPGPVRT